MGGDVPGQGRAGQGRRGGDVALTSNVERSTTMSPVEKIAPPACPEPEGAKTALVMRSSPPQLAIVPANDMAVCPLKIVRVMFATPVEYRAPAKLFPSAWLAVNTLLSMARTPFE